MFLTDLRLRDMSRKSTEADVKRKFDMKTERRKKKKKERKNRNKRKKGTKKEKKRNEEKKTSAFERFAVLCRHPQFPINI